MPDPGTHSLVVHVVDQRVEVEDRGVLVHQVDDLGDLVEQPPIDVAHVQAHDVLGGGWQRLQFLNDVALLLAREADPKHCRGRFLGVTEEPVLGFVPVVRVDVRPVHVDAQSLLALPGTESRC
jgi:hypothetical protein